MSRSRWFARVGAAVLVTLAWPLSAAAQSAHAVLKDTNGRDVGLVSLLQTPGSLLQAPGGVLLKLSLKGLPPGEHAFHIHTAGKCEPPSFRIGREPFQSLRFSSRPAVGPGPCRRHAEPLHPTDRRAGTRAGQCRNLTRQSQVEFAVSSSRRHVGGDPRWQGRLHDRSRRQRRGSHRLRRDQRRRARSRPRAGALAGERSVMQPSLDSSRVARGR